MTSFEIRSTAAILLVFLFAAAYQVEKSAGATTYVVGDSTGWTIPNGGAAFYTSWASGHTFSSGDVLVFNFPTGLHDVAEVDKASFDNCSASNPTTLATVGPASITLTTVGDKFFICTFGQHCSLGQKLTLKVSGASTSPPPPAPSPNATASTPPPTAAATPPPTAAATPPPSSTKPLAPSPSSPPTAAAAAPKATPSTPSSSPPTAAAAAPKATPSTPSSSSPTAAAPKAAAPSTTTTSPAKSPAVTPSSATPPSTSSISPTIAPAPNSGGPGGPEIPSPALSPGGSGAGGVNAAGIGPSASSAPRPSGSATKIDAVSTLLGLIVAIAGIAFVGY